MRKLIEMAAAYCDEFTDMDIIEGYIRTNHLEAEALNMMLHIARDWFREMKEVGVISKSELLKKIEDEDTRNIIEDEEELL